MPRQRCPYLGLESDPQTCHAFPSEANYCHRLSAPQSIETPHQSAYCLTPGYSECKIFQHALLRARQQSVMPGSLPREDRRRAALILMWLSAAGLITTIMTGLYLFNWTPVSAVLFGHATNTPTAPNGFVLFGNDGTPKVVPLSSATLPPPASTATPLPEAVTVYPTLPTVYPTLPTVYPTLPTVYPTLPTVYPTLPAATATHTASPSPSATEPPPTATASATATRAPTATPSPGLTLPPPTATPSPSATLPPPTPTPPPYTATPTLMIITPKSP